LQLVIWRKQTTGTEKWYLKGLDTSSKLFIVVIAGTAAYSSCDDQYNYNDSPPQIYIAKTPFLLGCLLAVRPIISVVISISNYLTNVSCLICREYDRDTSWEQVFGDFFICTVILSIETINELAGGNFIVLTLHVVCLSTHQCIRTYLSILLSFIIQVTQLLLLCYIDLNRFNFINTAHFHKNSSRTDRALYR
jgi:hypothetical protein